MTRRRALIGVVFAALTWTFATSRPAGVAFPGAAWAASAGGAGGGPAVARPPLPPPRSVDAILADVIAAVGGEAALRKHRAVHTKMEITFKGLGITGTAEHFAAMGDKALTITEIPNLASTREGSDGKTFWSEDPINGLRILEGAEAEQARIEVAWNAELRTKELFQRVEAGNERAEDGQVLECLTLTPKLGGPMVNCFDTKTHLMALQKGVRSGPQGDMPFTARLSDWRTVGDVKLAHATDMQVGPLAFTGRVISVEMDGAMPATLFAVPSAGKPGKGKATGDQPKVKADKVEKTSKVGNPGPADNGGKPGKAGKSAPKTESAPKRPLP